MTLMTSGVIQRQLWRPFHKTSSKIVLKGGLGAGIGAWLPKGSNVKATTVVFSNEACSTFTAMSSRTLLYDHVLVAIASVSLAHVVLRKETRSLYYVTAPKNTDETQIITTVSPTHYFLFHFCWLATFTLPLALFGERRKLMLMGNARQRRYG